MDLLADLSLAAMVWVTLLVGRPFAFQYARKGLPPERWNDQVLVEGCRFISLVWALFTSLSFVVSVYRHTTAPLVSEQTYFGISLAIIAGGIIFTTLFKRQNRLQREGRKT